MLKSCCALLFLLFPCAAAAQYPGDEYYPYAEREERRELLTTDSTLFYRAVQSPSDLYGLRTGFNLPQVALRRRGLDYTLERTSLMGVAVSYRYLAALRLLGAEEQRYAGLAAAPGEPAAAGGMRAFRFSDGEPLQPFLASVRFTDRNYLVGAKAAVSASPGDGWRISAGPAAPPRPRAPPATSTRRWCCPHGLRTRPRSARPIQRSTPSWRRTRCNGRCGCRR